MVEEWKKKAAEFKASKVGQQLKVRALSTCCLWGSFCAETISCVSSESIVNLVSCLWVHTSVGRQHRTSSRLFRSKRPREKLLRGKLCSLSQLKMQAN